MSDLVIVCPMWNFGIPPSLKAWIDYVVRAGKTFNYTGAGEEGLAKGKKAILVLASGEFAVKGLGNLGIPWSHICARSWASLELTMSRLSGPRV
jgi:FMN-dependent NADH-azoreductase